VELTTYNQVSALHIDPIEKKPLYHFYPSQNILSIGNVGCNLSCKFCQNWEIAHCDPLAERAMAAVSTGKVVEEALGLPDNMGIAYTYNEPVVWYEYMYDIAAGIKAQNKDKQNVVVTNGFINPEPLEDLFKFTDAFSVDLKAFTDKFYKKLTKSSLNPILEALKLIHRAGKHLEVTNLLIPGYNDDADDFRRMLDWIAENLDENVPLHISRFHPAYKMTNTPPTSPKKLREFYKIAASYMHYVFLGNISIEGTSDTYCKSCGKPLIRRSFFQTDISGLDAQGKCKYCGEKNIAYI